MHNPYVDIFRKKSRPLEPIDTDVVPVLKKLAGIRAVLFDVYGTLIISASGEVGTVADQSQSRAATPRDAIVGAFRASGITDQLDFEAVERIFFQAIKDSHAHDRAQGIEYPEVDIAAIWATVLGKLVDSPTVAACDLERLAVEYESRVNPCWPMPHLRKCLGDLLLGGQNLGIISNAQFFTPLVLLALMDETLEDLGFRSDLQYYSYKSGFAKPGTGLFELAAGGLDSIGIAPGEVIFVGNDMLNDILPASKVGFSTALFAGDNRSLRRREGDPRVGQTFPNIVLTDLAQLAECVCS